MFRDILTFELRHVNANSNNNNNNNNKCFCCCGAQVDAHGCHTFICKRAPGRIARHRPILLTMSRGRLWPLASQSPRNPSGWQDKMPNDNTGWRWYLGSVWKSLDLGRHSGSYRGGLCKRGGSRRWCSSWTSGMSKISQIRQFRSVRSHVSTDRGRDAGPSERVSHCVLVWAGPKDHFSVSGDIREANFLFQRISVTVQRSNFILLYNSFSSDEEWPLQLYVLTLLLTLGGLYYRGYKEK